MSDTSQPKQGTLPKEDGLKNDDIDVCFSQLKLDDKGQYKNVLSCVIARKQIINHIPSAHSVNQKNIFD